MLPPCPISLRSLYDPSLIMLSDSFPPNIISCAISSISRSLEQYYGYRSSSPSIWPPIVAQFNTSDGFLALLLWILFRWLLPLSSPQHPWPTILGFALKASHVLIEVSFFLLNLLAPHHKHYLPSHRIASFPVPLFYLPHLYCGLLFSPTTTPLRSLSTTLLSLPPGGVWSQLTH